jgi:hypothetical protein
MYDFLCTISALSMLSYFHHMVLFISRIPLLKHLGYGILRCHVSSPSLGSTKEAALKNAQNLQ